MTVTTPHTTLQLLAKILNPQITPDVLKPLLLETTDWDNMVIVASGQLMLPALYGQLKTKALLDTIPLDLKLYLEEITAINRNRNQVLLEEARAIAQLFTSHGIDFVFIKGIAMLGQAAFNDIGERMVGDIDIVVREDQLDLAFNLLTQNGYTQTVEFDYVPKNYRHLARQIHPDKMGAVELHREVLIHTKKHLLPAATLLKNKQVKDGFPVPSKEDSIKIAILTTQINDKANYYVSIKLKTIYDCMALGLDQQPQLVGALSKQYNSQAFLQLASIYFPILKPRRKNRRSKLIQSYYLFKMNHPQVGFHFQKILQIVSFIKERTALLVHNKSYRNHIFKNKLN